MPFRFGKSKIAGLLEYLITLILVFDINTIWLRKDNLGDDFFTYVGVIFMIVYILYSGKLKIKRKEIILLIISVIYAALMSMGNLSVYTIIQNTVTVGIGFVVMLQAVKRNHESERKPLIEKFCDIVVVLASVSLFFYFFGTVMNLLLGKTTAFYKWGGDRTVGSYFNLYFETYTPNYLLQILLGHTVYRNTSIFPESPMFAYVLCLALAKEVLGKTKCSIPRITILVITIFTTGSTTGANVILLILGLYELQKICDNRTHKSWRAIGVALLPFFAVFLIYAVSYLMSYKLETMSTSYNIRSDDWSACLRVFFSSPIWGVGINNYKPIYNSFSSAVYRTGIGLSTGLFILLAQTGVSIIIWPILGLIRNKYERWGYSLLIVFLVLFSVTNVPYKLLNVLYVGSILITSKREIEAKGVV